MEKKFFNFVVAVGSVDGICTSAAALRTLCEPETEIVFTQAFTVDRLDPTAWPTDRKVLFIDLAVNNRDEAMTVDFLRRITKAGHQVSGVLDEHSREDWEAAIKAADLDFNSLLIKPVSQATSAIKSSGALLLSILSNEIDEHTQELLGAADSGDKMKFDTHFGGLVNRAVKSKIGDESRRVYLAKYFAENTQPDETILSWIGEYDKILANHQEIIANRQGLGDGIVRVITIDKVVDMTTLMSQLYKLGAKVVIVEGLSFNKSVGRPTLQISFGSSDNQLDILGAIKAAGITSSGFTSKANVEPEDEAAALAAVRQLLQ
ncbi:hypothetical protein EOM71_01340 [Candidatus Falkowbacteria bacterium]|nr:hypothetical protein [Candidatus Falkowbacteria bacterium]